MRLAALTFLAASLLPAQDTPAAGSYKVEFLIHDDAGAKATRRYTILIDPGGKGVFRSGQRIPVNTGKDTMTYVDVGVNIDARLRLQGTKAVLNTDIEISSAAPLSGPGSQQPKISQLRISANAALAPGKQTLIAAVDDPATTRKVEVEALVTPLP